MTSSLKPYACTELQIGLESPLTCRDAMPVNVENDGTIT
jgi:hypothetical protein